MSTLETNSIGKYSGNNVSIDDALNLKSYDTAGRDALTSVAGDIIYNSTDNKVQVYSGSAWEDLGGLKTASVDFLVVAGGGGGCYSRDFGYGSGGGGAGGYLNSYGTELSGGDNSSLDSVRILADGSTTYTVTVGAGGSAGTSTPQNGSNSQFTNQIAEGGGRGARRDNIVPTTGGSAGGGASYNGADNSYLQGISPRGVYTQGYFGGDGYNGTVGGGGGGGATERGDNGTSSAGGAGGDGLSSSITGSAITRAGGGAGGYPNTSGGAGGGGVCNVNGDGQAGTVNTGGGGGGGFIGINGTKAGGAGGSGVVILRWATADATIGATRTGLTDGGVQTDGNDSYIVFTEGTGTITFS